MSKYGHHNNPLDDLADIEGGSNLYDICEKMKLNGATNSELRAYLKDNGVSIQEIREIVRQVDNDFLSGKIQKPPGKIEKTVAPIIGGILIFI